MKTQNNQPIETLRLSDREKAKLLWAIDKVNQQDDKQEQRRLRVSCTNNEAVFTLKTDSSGETRFTMLARNISRWGTALVHGRYIYPASRCEVMLQTNNGQWQKIAGIVRHARHIQGTVHELGVAFDSPIDLGDFVNLSAADEARYLRELADDVTEADKTDVVVLSNRVLVVDDFASDRKLFGHWLTQAGLTVVTTSDSRSTHAQVQEQIFDLLVVDYKLDTGSGMDLIRELRKNQFTAPIIAISSDDSETLEAQMLDAGADAFLRKPFTQERLMDTAYELIGVNALADLTPIHSSLKDDADMRPLLTEFTRSLSAYIEELRDANAQNDFDTIEHLSHRLKGAGSGYGFPAISEQAGILLQSLNDELAEIDTIKQATSELITTLNRIKLS